MKTIPVQLFLEPFISKLNFEVCTSVSNYDTIEECTTLDVCDTGHLDPCYLTGTCDIKTININGVEFDVKDYVYCESITVFGQPAIADEYKITLPAPKYLYGTPLSVNQELADNKNCDKYPLVYLFEPITESFDDRWDSCIEREVSVKLFFMNATNPEDNCNKDFVDELLPMRNLAERFVDCIKNDRKHFSGVTNFKLTSHSNFGRLGKDGYFEQYFNENLNAIQLDVSFSINKNSCNNKCYCINS